MSHGYYVRRAPEGRSIFGGKVYGEGAIPRHDIATMASDPRLISETGQVLNGPSMTPSSALRADTPQPIMVAGPPPGLPVGPLPTGAQQSDKPTPIAPAPGSPRGQHIRRGPIGRSIFGGPVYGEGSIPARDIATAASDPRLIGPSGEVLNAERPQPIQPAGGGMMREWSEHPGWRRGRQPMDGYRGFGLPGDPGSPDTVVPVGAQDRIVRGPGRGVPIQRDFFGRPVGPRGSIAVGIRVGGGEPGALPVNRRWTAPPIDPSLPPGAVPIAPIPQQPIGRSIFGRPVWNDGPHAPQMVRTPGTNELPTGNTGIFNDAGQDFGASPDGLGSVWRRRGGFG
jgi:hypothetical protein